MVGLDLKGLFQPKRFYGSINKDSLECLASGMESKILCKMPHHYTGMNQASQDGIKNNHTGARNCLGTANSAIPQTEAVSADTTPKYCSSHRTTVRNLPGQ